MFLDLEREAVGRLRSLLARNPDLDAKVRAVLAFGEAVCFGGWVRDTLHSIIHTETVNSRDFDVVVEGPLAHCEGERLNHFGGQRLTMPNGMKIDCWELASTLAFRRGLLPPSFENLTLSTIYRLNGCFLNLGTFKLHGAEAADDIRERRIAFNCQGYLDVYAEYQAFRAIDLADRLRYTLDTDVSAFVASTLRKAGPEVFVREVLEHRRQETPERLLQLFAANSTRDG